jgi:hypothetical protein
MPLFAMKRSTHCNYADGSGQNGLIQKYHCERIIPGSIASTRAFDVVSVSTITVATVAVNFIIDSSVLLTYGSRQG